MLCNIGQCVRAGIWWSARTVPACVLMTSFLFCEHDSHVLTISLVTIGVPDAIHIIIADPILCIDEFHYEIRRTVFQVEFCAQPTVKPFFKAADFVFPIREEPSAYYQQVINNSWTLNDSFSPDLYKCRIHGYSKSYENNQQWKKYNKQRTKENSLPNRALVVMREDVLPS